MTAAQRDGVLEAFRKVRDDALNEYARIKVARKDGLVSAAQLDKARAAYMLAQSEYRSALLAARMDPQPGEPQ